MLAVAVVAVLLVAEAAVVELEGQAARELALLEIMPILLVAVQVVEEELLELLVHHSSEETAVEV
jgi:hypothetical protein